MLEAFKEFGLAGVVIGALFLTIAALAKRFLAHLETISERHQEHVDAIMDSQRDERVEWAVQETKRAEIYERSLNKVVDKLGS